MGTLLYIEYIEVLDLMGTEGKLITFEEFLMTLLG